MKAVEVSELPLQETWNSRDMSLQVTFTPSVYVPEYDTAKGEEYLSWLRKTNNIP